MAEPRKLSDLFRESPRQWGLRGDPHLWNEMASVLADRACPATEAQCATLLEQTFEQLAGVPLTRREPVFLERHSHGGMSSGHVSPVWWAEKALPWLLAKYRETP